MNYMEVLKYTGVGVAGLAIGYTAGYYLTKQRLLSEFEGAIQAEIASLEDHYARRAKTQKYSTPEKAFEEIHGKAELDKIVAPYQSDDTEDKKEEFVPNIFENTGIPGYDPEVEEPVSEPKHVKSSKYATPVPQNTAPTEVEDDRGQDFAPGNIFDIEQPDEESLGEPMPNKRHQDKPYIIATDEFMIDDDEYDKITITYFEEDDTLMDDAEQIISDIEGNVGAANLHKFGEGSGNPDILYIRNERIKTDFEIAREEGSYAKVVLGFDPAPKSSPYAVRKMRREDD